MLLSSSSRFRRLAKESSWIGVGQIVSVVGSFVLVRMLTGYLDPEQYGQLALGLTFCALVNQLVMGGIIAGIGRFYSIAAEKRDVMSYLRSCTYLLIYATLVVIALGGAFVAGLLLLGYFRWMGIAFAVIVFAVLTGYNGALNGIQNAARQRVVVAFHGGLNSWLKILLAIGVMHWFGSTSTSVVIGYSCSLVLIVVSQLLFLRKTILPRLSNHLNGHQPWIQHMWSYSWPLCTWGLFTWMQLVSDRWALQNYATMADVGQYAVLFQLGYTPIAMITGMAMSFIGPILYQRSGDATDNSRNINVHEISWRITYLSLALTLLGVLLAFVMHDILFLFLVAPEYRSVSYLLPWVVLAGGVFAAGQMLALKLMSEMKSGTMTLAKIVTALLGVIFNVIGASLAGITGVVGGLVAFSVVYFVWMAVLARGVALAQPCNEIREEKADELR